MSYRTLRIQRPYLTTKLDLNRHFFLRGIQRALELLVKINQITELLFQVLAERHEGKSVIITSKMGFGDWTQIFGDPNLMADLLDRITHKANIINCDWDSYRLKETLKKERKKQK